MSFRRPQAARLAVAAVLLSYAFPALAEESESAPPQQAEREGSGATSREVYFPSEFERFAPRNAADLIERIPGFEVDDRGGGGSRGFGQAQSDKVVSPVRGIHSLQ